MWEISSPFLHVRYFLLNAGYKHTVFYTIVQLCVLLAFFGCRIVWGLGLSVFFWRCSALRLAGALPDPVPAHFLYYARGANIFLNSLNLFWFSKMIRALVNVLMKKQGEEYGKVKKN